MNKIWLYLISFSIVSLIFTSPQLVIDTMIETSNETVMLCIKLFAIYAIWLGILEILETTNLSTKLATKLSPLISKLFKTKNPEAIKYISLNLSANIFGLGNAATPSGIEAMKHLDDKSGKANFAMIMFVILNSCAIQLIPTTIIGLRANLGSDNASNIILPTIISSFVSTLIGISLVFLFEKIYKRRKNK